MRTLVIGAIIVCGQRGTAQKPPAVRQIGRLEHVTTDPFARVGTALAMRDGRVLVLRDGTIAVVRGCDYHIDWLDRGGKWSSSPKLPFDWQKLDDARKQALIDST